MAISGVWRNPATTPLPGDCVFLLEQILEHRLWADVPRLLGRHPSSCVAALRSTSSPYQSSRIRVHTSCGMGRIRTQDLPDRRLPLVWKMAARHTHHQGAAMSDERSSRKSRRPSRSPQPPPSRRGFPCVPLCRLRLPKSLPNPPLQIKTSPPGATLSPHLDQPSP